MLAHTSCREGVLVISQVHLRTIDIDLRLHRRIHSSHHDIRRKGLTRIKGGLLGDNKRIELVHTDILHVDIRHEGMEHLTFCVTHITLKLGEQGDSSGHRHILKHILLPVFSHGMGIGRQFGGHITADHTTLTLIAHHLEDSLTERVDGIVEFLATTFTRSQHHLCGCL